jgi:hypothetical protein
MVDFVYQLLDEHSYEMGDEDVDVALGNVL